MNPMFVRKVLVPGLAVVVILFLGLKMAGVDQPQQNQTSKEVPAVSFTDYGNNVYYFPETIKNDALNYEEFGNALSLFRKEHANLEIISVAAYDYYGGYTAGYFVICRPASQSK